MKKLILIFLPIILLSQCKKEEEILISDVLYGSWELSSYFRNNIDETTGINIVSYMETWTSSGQYSRSYIDSQSELIQETGSYIIDESTDVVTINGISSIDDFSEHHSTLSTSQIQLLEYSSSKLVYSFENGGDSHKFVFVKAIEVQ